MRHFIPSLFFWVLHACVFVVGIAGPASWCHAETLYAGTAQLDGTASNLEFSLVTINEQTGALSPTSATSPIKYVDGLDFTPDGSRLYGLSNSLYSINPTNGQFTVIGPLTLNGGPKILMASMTISPSGQMLALGNGDNKLYQVDTATGHLSVLSVLSTPTTVRAIEFGPDGTLYGAFTELYKLDPQTGAVLADLGRLTRAGETIDTGAFISEMDFSHGVLRGLAIDYDGAPFTPRLYNINLSAPSGQMTDLIVTLQGNVSSIASVPEPSTLASAALGALALLAINRRRRN